MTTGVSGVVVTSMSAGVGTWFWPTDAPPPTAIGASEWVPMPSPTWPRLLSPQQDTVRSSSTAQLLRRLAPMSLIQVSGRSSVSGACRLTCPMSWKPPMPTPSWPSWFSPQQVDIDVLVGDEDEDGDPLTISGFPVVPAHGTVSVEGGKVRYVPD